ncbi:phosphoadenosine phosphosulfate reductase domain-containing protein [Chengkuizengella axinellae]|uniref:Phosphoadenosine phosphosulfate reductase family protein n=1 Tax=Chengkuizengella axinellae TaxID=3064388 RepID=A0ABT9J6V7_9BACL|nr:phosphoadenosine phosphosulfate reductase family protein [Chengkuizengella sp. 2205SS18-9]MDP5277202.1 phosphoadenosine phosphosulfate reductase family protein [Chengkuizengella sp. 2205SS18-9]
MKDIHVISLGAGVQSTTMLLMACRGEFEPKPDLVIFSDTGWEPKNVYEHLEWLKDEVKKHGIEIAVTNNGNIKEDIVNSINDSKRFASLPFFVKNKDGSTSMVRRQCTNEYKIMPVRKAIRNHLGYVPKQRVKEMVHLWMGISTDEIQRVKESRERWITHRYPLIEKWMTRLDCMNWLQRNGYPVPPKSSCVGCPFHDNHMWLDMKRNDLESWNEAVEMDREIRRLPQFKNEIYLHRSCVPLDQVNFNENQIEMFEDCTGYCGV